MFSLKKVWAMCFLGLHFFTHWFKKMGTPRKGVSLFLKEYQPDGIFALSPKDRDQFSGFERCVVCRECDWVCPQRGVDFKGFQGPSYFVGAISRHLPHMFLSVGSLPDCAGCGMPHPCIQKCPTSVPITDLLDFVRSRGVDSL